MLRDIKERGTIDEETQDLIGPWLLSGITTHAEGKGGMEYSMRLC